MTLRYKLFVVFSALAVIALLVTGVALFLTLTWQSTTAQVERHYQRSLLLQRIRAGTFQALKEVDDALTGDHVDAKNDFERALQPTSRDFSEWSSLADTPDERAEVARVQTAHERLIGSARQVFELIPKDRAAATQLVDDEIDTRAYEQFRLLTEEGVQADREHRRAIAAETDRVRTTTQVMLAISAFSILSLIFLLAAYLTHDLFRPLRELVATLERLQKGDLKARAEEGRNDEIGAAARSLNLFAASVERRIRIGTVPAESAEAHSLATGGPIRSLVAAIQTNLAKLKDPGGPDAGPIISETEGLARAMGRFSEIALPLDLDLEKIELPALIHSVLSRHRAELVRRAISVEVTLAPEIQPFMGDRLKLREALSEMVRNALGRLPEKGGRLGFRTIDDSKSNDCIRIEIAHDGRGMEPEQLKHLTDSEALADPLDIGFVMARRIVERHGGKTSIFSEGGDGTVVQFSLPVR